MVFYMPCGSVLCNAENPFIYYSKDRLCNRKYVGELGIELWQKLYEIQ